MQRSFVFKAWIISPTESEVLLQAHRVVYEFTKAAQMEDSKEARIQFANQIKELWTPNRQEPSRWIEMEHRRFLTRRKKKELLPFEEWVSPGAKGMLFGVFHTVAAQRTWDDVIERGKVERLVVRTYPVGEKDGKITYEVDMPLWTERDQPKLIFRFLAHREFPKDATFYRFFLVAWPKIRDGKLIGYRWEINIRVEMPEPTPRMSRRMGFWEPRWRAEKDGRVLVGVLTIRYLDKTEKVVRYHLPAGTISRARRVYHGSVTGQDTVEYEKFNRWRADLYRKIAVDITRRVDTLDLMRVNTAKAQHQDPKRYRAMVSSGALANIIMRTAKREGLIVSH